MTSTEYAESVRALIKPVIDDLQRQVAEIMARNILREVLGQSGLSEWLRYNETNAKGPASP